MATHTRPGGVLDRLGPGLTALCASILFAAGCGWGSDGGSRAGEIYDDAGNCVKDREELSEILVQPIACTTSNECPGGSFCNGETDQCDWQCYTDSDCGFGGACTCDGQCTDGTPPDPGEAEDPACPRNLHLLQGQHIDDTDCPTGASCPATCASDAECPYNTSCDLAVSKCKYPTLDGERECLRDEQCPSGARCDSVSHRCTFDCVADTDCSAGEVCDCRGECVLPGTPSEGPDMTAAKVEVTPGHIPVPADHAWGKQTISIRITSPDESLANQFLPRARIEVRDPDDLGAMGIVASEQPHETVTYPAGVPLSESEKARVLNHADTQAASTLEADGIPASTAAAIVAARPFNNDIDALLAVENVGATTIQALKTATEIQSSTSSVEIDVLDDEWDVDATDGYTAIASVSIERGDAPTTGDDAYPRDVAVTVYFVDAASPTTVAQELDHRLVTIGTEGVADTAPTVATGEFSGVVYQETTGAEPLAIPVKAWGTTTGTLLVQDELRLISGTGWFELESGASTVVDHIDQETNNGGIGDGQSPGRLAGELSEWSDDLLSGGRRDGTFQLNLLTSPAQPVLFRYRLDRQGDDDPPDPGVSPPDQAEHTLVNVADLWRAGAGIVESGSSTTNRDSIERLLCYDYEDYASSPTLRDFAFQDSSDATLYPSVLWAPSRDLQCSTQSQSAVGLLTGWSKWATWLDPTPLPPITNPPEGAANWLSQCLADLTRKVSTVGSSGSTSERLKAWLGAPGACINLPQLFPTLGALVHGDVDGTDERYLDRADSTLFQRLLAQWLDVHGFVLQQGMQESKAQAHLADALTSEDPVRLEDILAQAERAWDVLFDPDFLDVLARVPRDNLAEPDYRLPRPAAYWTFDAADRSGNHFLDAAGERHIDLAGSYLPSGGGIELQNSSATLPPGDLAPHGDVTVSFWFKRDFPGQFDDFVFRNGGALEIELEQDGGQWRLRIRHDVAPQYLFTPWQSDLSTWTHIAIVRSGSQYVVYKNGAWLQSGWPSTPAPSYNASQMTKLLEASSLFVDDMAIWEQALSENMVQQIHAAGQSSASNPRPLLNPIGQLWDPQSPSYQGDDPDAEQGLGLAVKIAETASKHAAAVETFAGEQLAEVYGGCYLIGSSTGQQRALERVASGLRYVGTAEALARDLRYRAAEVPCTQNLECTYAGGSTCGAEGLCLNADSTVLERPLAWAERFDSAMRELGAARGRAVTAMKKLARCENPLGIPENDQPIYFGDVAGENSRYFASSDYLVETWARPAVQMATNSLEAARGAWLAARDSDIRQQMNEYEAERRLESIELGYMNPVMDACGITDMDGLEVLDAFDPGGSLKVGTCYRKPGCESDDDPKCLRGTLGEAMLSVKAAAKALGVEQNQSKRRLIEWMAQVDTCQFKADSIGGDLVALQLYREAAKDARKKSRGTVGEFADWLGQKIGGMSDDLDGDTLGHILEDSFRGCLSGLASGAGGGPAAAGAGCFLGAEIAALTSGGGADHDLAEAREQLDYALAVGQAEREMRACYDELDRRQRDWFFGQDSIRLRRLDLQQAWFRLDEIGRDVVRNLQEARAAIDREVGRTLPSVAHHYWTDEKIDRFGTEFQRAKRLTYLAMRAVEYEFQQSLGLRTDILTASHPDILLGAIYALDVERGTRTINSRRPAAGTEVLSLRTDILALGNLKPPAPGERSDSASLRLQDMLRDPQFAYRDEEGNYLGQAIPFSLEESGALRHRCGERLWRVNATIQGDLNDIDEPRAQVFLRKKNVFQSQWCEGLGDGTPYQEASTAGGTNLFTADRSTVGREGSEYTTSLIFPWYNVRRSDFYREAYTEGASEELAGRGLYGEYVLLFPFNGMLEPPLDCDDDEGVGCANPYRHLEKIEDVLIRFDYYSVDDL
jgi:hypothetical protein